MQLFHEPLCIRALLAVRAILSHKRLVELAQSGFERLQRGQQSTTVLTVVCPLQCITGLDLVDGLVCLRAGVQELLTFESFGEHVVEMKSKK